MDNTRTAFQRSVLVDFAMVSQWVSYAQDTPIATREPTARKIRHGPMYQSVTRLTLTLSSATRISSAGILLTVGLCPSKIALIQSKNACRSIRRRSAPQWAGLAHLLPTLPMKTTRSTVATARVGWLSLSMRQGTLKTTLMAQRS